LIIYIYNTDAASTKFHLRDAFKVAANTFNNTWYTSTYMMTYINETIIKYKKLTKQISTHVH